jgi:DNA-binding response OmpR family regulator
MPQTILVADDEAKIVDMVASYLEASGFRVQKAGSGSLALESFRLRPPDCLILDINMPGLDGLAVAREVRKSSELPIIFLTARADEVDRILGLELGGDDYVTKPFSPRELVARVRAVLRRSSPREAGARQLVRGRLELDGVKRSLRLGGEAVILTTIQFDILALMMAEPGRVWTRLDILEGTSGSAFEGYERTVDAHIKNLRKALGDDSESPRFIETVRGVGYRFMEQADEA